MTQRDNILQELKELESRLANLSSQNMYTVPNGYFEGLADQVLNRIKALEVINASDELSFLSATLSNFSKETPYIVPSGYFEELGANMLQLVSQDNDQTAKEELETLSPLLSGLKKENPYSVPAGYFENFQNTKQEAKVVSITSRKWFKYAAAAVIVGVVATTALFISNASNPEKSLARFEKKLDKEIKKASDKELIEFAELTAASKDMAFIDTKDDVKELLKDVPAAELQEFLEEIADPNIDNNNTLLQE